MSEFEHGTPVESWTLHTHSVLFICPTCRQPVTREHQSHYTIEYPHVIDCECGQSFGVSWPKKAQDAQITIHTWVDTDNEEQEP